jgi:molybdate transport system substrate-binding protein
MKTVFAALLALFVATTAAAQSLTVAAASDLQPVLPEIAKRFEREMKIPVTTTFGSSGNFFAQIENGAPFDLFLSADVEYPGRLEDDGFAVRGSRIEYAVGRIVLWTRKDSGVNVSMGFGILASPRVRRIAIANPEHAPYGRAAIAALEHERLYQELKGKLVLGENVSQAAQFVQSGNADAGIFALSLAKAPPLRSAGTMYEIPDDWYRPIIQSAVVLENSRQKNAAKQFLDFLRRPEIARIFEQAGFSVKKQ